MEPCQEPGGRAAATAGRAQALRGAQAGTRGEAVRLAGRAPVRYLEGYSPGDNMAGHGPTRRAMCRRVRGLIDSDALYCIVLNYICAMSVLHINFTFTIAHWTIDNCAGKQCHVFVVITSHS